MTLRKICYVGLHYVYADVYNSSSNTVDRITAYVISPIDRIICYMSNLKKVCILLIVSWRGH